MIAVLNINNIEFFSLFYLCLYVCRLNRNNWNFQHGRHGKKTNFQLAKKLKHAIIRSKSTEVPLKSTLGTVFYIQSFTFILLQTFFIYMITKKKMFSKTVDDVVLQHCPLYLADRESNSKSAGNKNLWRKWGGNKMQIIISQVPIQSKWFTICTGRNMIMHGPSLTLITFSAGRGEPGEDMLIMPLPDKGQLISEWNFGVFKSPKKPTKS